MLLLRFSQERPLTRNLVGIKYAVRVALDHFFHRSFSCQIFRTTIILCNGLFFFTKFLFPSWVITSICAIIIIRLRLPNFVLRSTKGKWGGGVSDVAGHLLLHNDISIFARTYAFCDVNSNINIYELSIARKQSYLTRHK